MALHGSRELRARLTAIKRSFKPIGRAWAEGTVEAVRPLMPRRTGKGVRSARVKNASMTRATVAAIYYMRMLDRGTRAYDIRPRKATRLRFEVGGRTVFAKRVHKRAQGGLGFGIRAARTSLRRHPMAAALIKEWNRAA